MGIDTYIATVVIAPRDENSQPADPALSKIFGQDVAAADLQIAQLASEVGDVRNKPMAYWLAGTDEYVPPLHTDYPERGNNVWTILKAVGITNKFTPGAEIWLGEEAFGMASVQELLSFDYNQIPEAGPSLQYRRDNGQTGAGVYGTYRDIMHYERDLKPILDWCLANNVTWLLYGFYDSGIYDR